MCLRRMNFMGDKNVRLSLTPIRALREIRGFSIQSPAFLLFALSAFFVAMNSSRIDRAYSPQIIIVLRPLSSCPRPFPLIEFTSAADVTVCPTPNYYRQKLRSFQNPSLQKCWIFWNS